MTIRAEERLALAVRRPAGFYKLGLGSPFTKGGETMLKEYIVDGKQYQYEEGTQPEGAVEVKKAEPSDKAVKPANKRKAVKAK